jgi:hypothetical protein
MQSNGRNTKRPSPIGQWRLVCPLWLVSHCRARRATSHIGGFPISRWSALGT